MERNRMPSKRTFATALLSLVLPLLAACTHPGSGGQPQLAQGQAQFPVAVPFALDRAGAKATVEFALPNTRENGVLRPVFIGFQRYGKAKKLTDAEVKLANEEALRLEQDPIPIRLRLEPIGASASEPKIALHEMQPRPDASGKYFYLPMSSNVATTHPATGDDSGELLHAGLYDLDNFYVTHEIARIVPPTPGRYRLQVESLEDQPSLRNLPFRLIVSHYYVRGIR